jgi:hypothetical protein
MKRELISSTEEAMVKCHPDGRDPAILKFDEWYGDWSELREHLKKNSDLTNLPRNLAAAFKALPGDVHPLGHTGRAIVARRVMTSPHCPSMIPIPTPKSTARKEIIKSVSNVEGDIVELGCGFADSTSDFNEALGVSDKHIYACDTFSGYTSDDLDEEDHYLHGLLQNKGRWDVANVDEITQIFDKTRVTIVQGDINETCKSIEPKSGKISLLVIDTNVYRPAKRAIDVLKKYFSLGCLVFIDSGFPQTHLQGEHRALLEYAQESENPIYRTFFGDFCGFFVEVVK